MVHDGFDLGLFVSSARRIGSDVSNVEVKSAQYELPKNVTETLSAFANGSGSVLVCGISEAGGFVPVEGFDAKRISDALAHMCSEKMEPPVRPDIDIVEFEGALVVVALIPETAPYLKPCYVKARGPYDGTFVRMSDGDCRLSRYEVDRLMEDRAQPRHDAVVVEDAGLDEFDDELVAGFLLRERAMSPRVFADLSDEDALLTMGAIGAAADGSLHPTLAGLMALGRHPQRRFPRANVTFAVFPGTSKDCLALDGVRFLDSRTIIGPIPVMVAETLAAIRRNMKVASYVEGAARVDAPDYPDIAIREAVANALMHRDYSPEGLGSQVQVNMFDDRLEVISPGGLYGSVTVDNIGRYGASASRNQYLSRILESTPYPAAYPESGYVVENKGTGYAQMQAQLRACGHPSAEPMDSLSLFTLTVFKRGGSSFRKDGSGWNLGEGRHGIGRAGRSAGSPSSVCENPASRSFAKGSCEYAIVELASERGEVSSGEVARELEVSRATALRHLKKLVASGYLLPSESQGRSAKYRLIAK